MAASGKYRPWISEEGLIKLEAWARDGLTDTQIAHNMGISLSTFYEWKKKYPEMSDSLKKGKEVVDILVENALLKRALGYEYKETIEELYEIPGTVGEDGKPKQRKHIKRITKYVQPDVTAQIFWLKNRKPDLWRDKQEKYITTVEDLEPLAELIRVDENTDD